MYRIGNKIYTVLNNLFTIIAVLPYSVSALTHDYHTKRQSFSKIFMDEVYYSGILALPMILIMGVATGFMVIILFPFETMSFGIQNIYGKLFSTIILRELAAYLTTFVVMIRSTIYITIQLTQMKINGEIETLELMGINPIQYLGSTRIIAGICSLPLLTVYFTIFSFAGGMLAAYFVNNVPIIKYVQEVYTFISFKDIFIFIFKTMISGIIIYLIAIYNGLTAKKSHNVIVGRTIRAITTSIFVVLLFNIFITASTYGTQ